MHPVLHVLVVLAILIHLGFMCHALRTGRHYSWVLRILAVPVFGPAAYYVSEIYPARKRLRLEKAAGSLLRTFERDAGRLRARGQSGTDSAAQRLRIVFADRTTLAYTTETPYEQPLGGSQSAACYLGQALAAAGHDVVLLNNVEKPQISRGVVCIGWDHTPEQALRELRPDAVVILLTARCGRDLRRIFGDDPKLILWTGHAHDQPAVQPLRDRAEHDWYDAIALMSDWQMCQFVQAFGIDRERVRVLGNAVGPAFRKLFAPGVPVAPAKERPPLLAYTSTPFRGLDLLLTVLPEIRRRVPGTRLKVFSSMHTYQVSDAQNELAYGKLYRRCRETEGVEYVGAVPQPRLAREMRPITALAYPNTFAETYCTSVLEAMAAGCRVVSSDLGALAQTTAGFARLVPMLDRDSYARAFVDEVVGALQESIRGDDAELLARQVVYVNEHCTWASQAGQWVEWITSMGRPEPAPGDDIASTAAATAQ